MMTKEEVDRLQQREARLEAWMLSTEERVRRAEGNAQQLCSRLERAETSLREALAQIGVALQAAAKGH